MKKSCWIDGLDGYELCVRDDPEHSIMSCDILKDLGDPELCEFYRKAPPEECELKLEFKVHDKEALIAACKKIPVEQRLWEDEELSSVPSLALIKEFLIHMDIVSGGDPVAFMDVGIELQNREDINVIQSG